MSWFISLQLNSLWWLVTNTQKIQALPPGTLMTVESGNGWFWLTHWGRVTHICVGKLTFTGSDNGLSPGRRQAIIWTNVGILLTRTWGTNFSEISYIFIQENAFENVVWKMAAILSRPQCVKCWGWPWCDTGSHNLSLWNTLRFLDYFIKTHSW